MRVLVTAVVVLFLAAPTASQAQIVIGPGTCPPGTVFVPPDQCIEPSPSPSPTPPTPTRDPIVLIPGITVSQNKKLLYEDKEDGKWKFALFFNVYKGLIKKLESAGYDEGDDLLELISKIPTE